VQSFILTEVSDCGLLIVVTSSFFSFFFVFFVFVCACVCVSLNRSRLMIDQHIKRHKIQGGKDS